MHCRRCVASLAADSASVRSRVPVSVNALAARVPAGAPHRSGLRRSAMTPTVEVVDALTSGVLNVRERSDRMMNDELLSSEIFLRDELTRLLSFA